MDILSSNFPQDKYSSEQIEKIRARFWCKVDKSGECWLWMRGINRNGYGVFGITPKYKMGAHRMAWILTHGSIPDGLLICHRCNNPRCVNPNHLYAGTPQDNMNDKVETGHHLNVPKGEAVFTSKLTEAQVQEIRGRYRKWRSGPTLRSLAKEYDVSYETIRLVVSNQSWK